MLDNEIYTVSELAERYVTNTAANVWNAEYERPALHALLGNVSNLNVLDAGCAGGENAKWLIASGARVTAIDASKAMVDIARRELGDRARVKQMDLGKPLNLTGDAFDIVVSSLTMHYLASWDIALSEFKRILRPGGRFVFSTHSPYLTVDKEADYHNAHLVTDLWNGFGSKPLEVRFYHRPLERILNDLIRAGFAISQIIEPGPERLWSRDPDAASLIQSQPWFMLIDARLPNLENGGR